MQPVRIERYLVFRTAEPAHQIKELVEDCFGMRDGIGLQRLVKDIFRVLEIIEERHLQVLDGRL